MLADAVEDLDTLIKGRSIGYIIINSWDFASKDYRRKAALIYLLNGWMDKYNVTVLVFSERMAKAPESQKIARGMGVGKLAAIAQEIKILKEDKPKVEEEDEEENEEIWDESDDDVSDDGVRYWNNKYDTINQAYEVIHGEQELLEREIVAERRWRIRDLARAEGLMGINGRLKPELHHILAEGYELTDEDHDLLEELKDETY